jgi:hypothetical protein
VSPETLFTAASSAVVPAWGVLLLAPRWETGRRLVCGVLVPGVLALFYVALLVTRFPGAPGGFGSLADVARLFQDPYLLLAGWLHYLAFDLFIGSWEARDARRVGLPHSRLAPCLVLTFLVGPAGLLLYLALRWGRTRRLALGQER